MITFSCSISNAAASGILIWWRRFSLRFHMYEYQGVMVVGCLTNMDTREQSLLGAKKNTHTH